MLLEAHYIQYQLQMHEKINLDKVVLRARNILYLWLLLKIWLYKDAILAHQCIQGVAWLLPSFPWKELLWVYLPSLLKIFSINYSILVIELNWLRVVRNWLGTHQPYALKFQRKSSSSLLYFVEKFENNYTINGRCQNCMDHEVHNPRYS
jgi:hypothetical protein